MVCVQIIRINFVFDGCGVQRVMRARTVYVCTYRYRNSMRMRAWRMQHMQIAILLRKNQYKVTTLDFWQPKRRKKKMADRDNNVYLAKLAEQAERYDGKSAQIMSSRSALILAKVSTLSPYFFFVQKWLRP